mgnify:CR=1 FL=1
MEPPSQTRGDVDGHSCLNVGLGKIGHMRNVDGGRGRIELPPLNITLVEVQRELATVRVGVKDMVTKIKSTKKAEKYAKQQLEEAQKTIADL